MSEKCSLLSLMECARSIQYRESLCSAITACCSAWSRHPTSEKSICTFVLYEKKIQWQECLHYPTISLLYFTKTSNVKNVYITLLNAVILCEGNRCHESLHCDHFYIVWRYPILHYVNTSKCQERLLICRLSWHWMQNTKVIIAMKTFPTLESSNNTKVIAM